MTRFTSDIDDADQASTRTGVIICTSSLANTWSFHWCADRSLSPSAMTFFQSQGWQSVHELPYSSALNWSATYPAAVLGGQNVATAAFLPSERIPEAVGSSLHPNLTNRRPGGFNTPHQTNLHPPSPNSARRQLGIATSS